MERWVQREQVQICGQRGKGCWEVSGRLKGGIVRVSRRGRKGGSCTVGVTNLCLRCVGATRDRLWDCPKGASGGELRGKGGRSGARDESRCVSAVASTSATSLPLQLCC